jgi:hypothetical protein
VLGYSPFQAGLRFLPLSVVSFFVAPVAGRLSARIPLRTLLGGGLMLVGAGLLLMSGLGVSSGWTHLVPGFLIAGAGVGMANPSLATIAVSVVPPARSGMASGINNTFRQVGIATGIAGLGAIFQHEVTRDTTAALSSGAGREVLQHATHAKLMAALVSGEVGHLAHSLPPAARAALTHSYRVGFTEAFTSILMIAAAIALAGAVFAFVLVRGRDFVSSESVPAAEQPAPAVGATG